jgi:hypothetical protein
MKRLLIFGLLALTLITSCGGGVTEQATDSGSDLVIKVYKPPT